MKKIELNLDALAVESFQTDGGELEPRGTVMGNQGTLNAQCYTRVGSCYRTACCPETTLC
ncbi:MAG TPA: hypothetical protein VFY65_18560 [Longimicrobium sp.]|nr:hypothetical protein [Longimicrobium sp.]